MRSSQRFRGRHRRGVRSRAPEIVRVRRHRPITEPKGFQGELRSYQREGLGWFGFLRDFGFGGCLADDMGLGKTVPVLALLEARRRAAGMNPARRSSWRRRRSCSIG
jgi:SNF2 family DNA or RNA helicase